MDRIVYKNPGGPDTISEIEIQESGACKYAIYCKVSRDGEWDVIYRTAGEAPSYDKAVYVCEILAKQLYALAMSGVKDEG